MAIVSLTSVALGLVCLAQSPSPRVLTTHRVIPDEDRAVLASTPTLTNEQLDTLGFRRRVIGGVEHVFDQNLGGLLDISYAMTTLRVLARFKNGDVLKSNELSDTERTALLSHFMQGVQSKGLNGNFEVGIEARKGVRVRSDKSVHEVWTMPTKSFDELKPFPSEPVKQEQNPLRNYAKYYTVIPVTSVCLKGRLSHTDLFESNSALNHVIADELKILAKELNEEVSRLKGHFGVELDKVGGKIDSSSLGSYSEFARLSEENPEKVIQDLASGTVERSVLGISFSVNIDGKPYRLTTNFGRF